MKPLSAIALLAMLAACGPRGPSVNDQVRLAVMQTMAAQPTHTPVPPPLPAILPTPTAATLRGIFCEYRFCMGHPDDMAFYDVIAKQNPGAPTSSRFDGGILAANTSSLFIQIIWQAGAPGADPASFVDLILESGIDLPSGAAEALNMGPVNASYTPITSSASGLLPYGGAAAWTCGSRLFAWKAYTTRPETARDLLVQALSVFRCE